MSADTLDRINALRQKAEGRAAHQREINAIEKRILWDRIQVEAPSMAEFMREARAKLGAETTEIKLNGKVVWEK